MGIHMQNQNRRADNTQGCKDRNHRLVCQGSKGSKKGHKLYGITAMLIEMISP